MLRIGLLDGKLQSPNPEPPKLESLNSKPPEPKSKLSDPKSSAMMVGNICGYAFGVYYRSFKENKGKLQSVRKMLMTAEYSVLAILCYRTIKEKGNTDRSNTSLFMFGVGLEDLGPGGTRVKSAEMRLKSPRRKRALVNLGIG